MTCVRYTLKSRPWLSAGTTRAFEQLLASAAAEAEKPHLAYKKISDARGMPRRFPMRKEDF